MYNTISEVFKVAIQAERTAEKLYQGLERKFAAHEDIASKRRLYAIEEGRHAEWLKDLETRLTAEQVSAPVDEHAVALINAFINSLWKRHWIM
jgi:rubrerythrin